MSRLKVTPKGKCKRNRPITRIGKKQYLKRRFAHIRKLDNAGKSNEFCEKYMKRNCTAQQNYTRLGLNIDPSAPKAVVEVRKKSVKPRMREGVKFEEPEGQRGSIGVPVSEEEGTMICNLITKYDTNFKRMSLDTKLNPFQLNPKQLQRRVVNYLKWERAAFPELYEECAKNGLILDNYSDPKLRLQRD